MSRLQEARLSSVFHFHVPVTDRCLEDNSPTLDTGPCEQGTSCLKRVLFPFEFGNHLLKITETASEQPSQFSPSQLLVLLFWNYTDISSVNYGNLQDSVLLKGRKWAFFLLDFLKCLTWVPGTHWTFRTRFMNKTMNKRLINQINDLLNEWVMVFVSSTILLEQSDVLSNKQEHLYQMSSISQ